MCFTKILGIDKNLFIALAIIITIILLTIFCVYICTVFVKKDEAIIIERNGKYLKTLESGWHFIIPLVDNKVGHISLLSNNLISKNKCSILSLNGYKICFNYFLSYNVTDPKKYFYFSNNIGLSLECIVSSVLCNYYSSIMIKNEKEFLALNKEILLDLLKDALFETGVSINGIDYISIF